jgi:hypothetical protein
MGFEEYIDCNTSCLVFWWQRSYKCTLDIVRVNIYVRTPNPSPNIIHTASSIEKREIGYQYR